MRLLMTHPVHRVYLFGGVLPLFTEGFVPWVYHTKKKEVHSRASLELDPDPYKIFSMYGFLKDHDVDSCQGILPDPDTKDTREKYFDRLNKSFIIGASDPGSRSPYFFYLESDLY